VAVLRILLGFALLPSGLKKVLGQPFTDPANHGPFHDFLHAFYGAGFLYTFVGLCQLVTALLLMTQRWASLGAAFMVPIITVILVLCWSTGAYPTAIVVSVMTLGTLLLVLWDSAKWRALLEPEPARTSAHSPASVSPHELRHVAVVGSAGFDPRRWSLCGLAIYMLYLLSCLIHGGVYRPRGLEWREPVFYVVPVLFCLLLATFLIERAAHRHER
jgi:uncharacterized membrane protein YphA (DoxX/SURF4 family)